MLHLYNIKTSDKNKISVKRNFILGTKIPELFTKIRIPDDKQEEKNSNRIKKQEFSKISRKILVIYNQKNKNKKKEIPQIP